ncbi:Arm DNA-binding domain-containing protein [Acetobacter malorum]|uniref:Arm DNA-binding domain-containing protein n=1 Tax=Acetobacter malorum TaxID=178901 RepID=UPI0031F03581
MDEDLKGFGLRVTERGSKVFLFQYRFAGRVRRMVLGPYGDLTPAQARKRAEEARGLYLAGRDPAGEKRLTRWPLRRRGRARRLRRRRMLRQACGPVSWRCWVVRRVPSLPWRSKRIWMT